MARIAGLSKDIADMALQLIREGADVDVALNSAARLSDATPKQVEFADDLIRRRNKAIENASPQKRTMGQGQYGDPTSVSVNNQLRYSPNSNVRRQLFRLNMSQTPNPEINRLTRSGSNYAFGRQTGLNAAENRLRQELALAAAEGNPERMQTILTELGFLPDYAYNIARQYSNPEQFAQLRDPNFIPGM